MSDIQPEELTYATEFTLGIFEEERRWDGVGYCGTELGNTISSTVDRSPHPVRPAFPGRPTFELPVRFRECLQIATQCQTSSVLPPPAATVKPGVVPGCIRVFALYCGDCPIAHEKNQKVQRNNNGSIDLLPDSLPDLPVSLVLLSLIVVDILEKLRMYPLRGREKSNEDGHIHVASLQQMKTVTEQVGQDGGSLALSQVAKAPGTSQPQLPSHVPVGPQEPSFDSGILRMMSRRDVRAEIFLWSFLRWADTIEMVRVAGHPAVYKSGWLYPVYIFSFLSVLRIVFTPENPLLSSLGVLLQDLPFVFVRFTLVIALGTITPILGLCKNVLVTLSYVYFNYLTRFRPFSSLETSLS
ncbi:Transmembrane protein 236 [Fukomys damarensis]|uniref:Transmembrane protein 236 n=1 Tax=Fukomys damarensis TaxID=885580 RepID=A0A091CW45_FUKDA|nr:Transmembrane protein 236 [Fukomys damarensis]